MDIEKHLILIKGKDKTREIGSCKYETGKWQVTFSNNKTYSYNYHNVHWLKKPTQLDSKTTVVYLNNQPLSGIEKILDFGEYIKLCYASGYQKAHHRSEVTVEKNYLQTKAAHSSFEYLKKLAETVSVAIEDDKSFLKKQYDRITHVSPASVLAKYLNRTQLANPKRGRQMPIFPFGFNISQKSATEKALSEQISVIDGPPGTGKTQTILNIIANAIINKETVAVVSNNNAATANVLEKLNKNKVGFIAAFLGNNDNKDKFFANQPPYPDMSNWFIDATRYYRIKKTLDARGRELNEMLEIKNKAAALRQQLSALSVEKKYFDTYYNETGAEIAPYRSFYHHSSDTVLALWLDYKQIAEKNATATATLKQKLILLMRYGIFSFSFFDNSNEKVIDYFQKLFYERKSQELNKQINALTKRLERYHFDDVIKEYSEISMQLFKANLAERFPRHSRRRHFTREALWKDYESFIDEYPVILSTTHSLRNCARANYLFDYVIIDEASQVDIVTGALALSCARSAVIVGDLKQLPNVVTGQVAEQAHQIFNEFKLSEAYRYTDNSILSSITKLYKNAPRTLLREHYRCHPKIIGFCNQKFYNNELIVLTEDNGRENPLVAYKTAMGNHARGTYNQRQIDVILEEVLPKQIFDDMKQSIGIISPYRLQTEKLKTELKDRNIEIDTVHKYQGREKDVIILTTVVNEVNEFVDNPNLLNVAISRAVDKLILVVSDNENNDNTNVGDLLRYIDYNNFQIVKSNIYSVFDLLYHCYSERLLEIMKNKKRVSDYQSENLMNVVIEKVLYLPEFNNLDRVMHLPLKMLIRNPEKLNKDEYRFAMNVLTHADFVIFNKLDKMPVLVVEVDGYAFHANNPKQLERDKMKDAILYKYNIPILRIRTNESGEETKLRNKLNEILL